MNRIIPIVVSVLLVVGVSSWQGHLSERWWPRTNQELDDFVANLKNVPLQIGDWESEGNKPEDEAMRKQLDRAMVRGEVIRTYRNSKTGEEINLFLVCGTSRRLFEHTPMQCYPAQGYDMAEQPIEHPVPYAKGEKKAVFAMTTFSKEHDQENSSHLQVFWSFTGINAKWQGPSTPKKEFGGTASLYKLYLVTIVQKEQWVTDPTTSPCHYFAAELIPALEEVLFVRSEDKAVDEDQGAVDSEG